MIKRILSVLLLLVLISVNIISCQKKAEQDAKETSPSSTGEETRPYLDSLPDTDKYNGITFNALVAEQSMGTNYISESPSSESSNALSQAVWQSTSELNFRFGISINYKPMDSYASGYQAFMQEIVNTTAAGAEMAYDLVIPGYWYGMTLTEYYLDLNKLPYIDFSQPWWCDGFSSTTEINGVRYAAVGAFCLGNIAGANAIVFNPEIIKDAKLTSPYAYYDNNLWTLENMLALRTAASEDIDENGRYDKSDKYGIAITRQGMDGFYISSGLHFVENNNGDFRLTKYSDKSESLYQQLYTCMYNDNTVYYGQDKAEIVDMFADSRALMACLPLETIQSLRHSEIDYSIIVYPKYDTNQSEYISSTNGCGVLAIPKTARDKEMSALVIEALNASFHKYVLPAFIDITLEGQTVRDERSVEMIGEIIDTIYWDFGFVNHTALGNVANFSIEMERGYSSMSSWYKTEERTYISKLNAYINLYK